MTDTGDLETQVAEEKFQTQVSPEARFVFQVETLEDSLVEARYVNLKLLQSLAEGLTRSHLSEGLTYPPRPANWDQTPRAEKLNFIAGCVVVDLKKSGCTDMADLVEQGAKWYSQIALNWGGEMGANELLSDLTAKGVELAPQMAGSDPRQIFSRAVGETLKSHGLSDPESLEYKTKRTQIEGFMYSLLEFMQGYSRWYPAILSQQ